MTPEGVGPDYNAEAVRCRACEIRDLQQQAAQEEASRKQRSLNGLYWAVIER